MPYASPEPIFSYPFPIVSTVLLSGERLKFLPVGDSITAGAGTPTATSATYSTYGYWYNALNSSQQEWELLDNKGVNGDRTSNVLARMSPILSSGAQVVALLIGTNDISAGIPIATISANVENIVDQMIGAGMKIILCQVGYRESSQNHNATIDSLNALYVGVAAARAGSVVLCPSFDTFNARISNPSIKTQVSADGLHPNSYGAWLMSSYLVGVMDSKFISTNPTYVNLLTNPELLGDTGGVFYNATGKAPTSWTLYFANPTIGVGGVVNGDGSFTMKSANVSGATDDTNMAYLQSNSVPVTAGKKYKFGIDVTMLDTSKTSRFEVYFSGGAGGESSMFKFTYPQGGAVGESITYNGDTIWTDDILITVTSNIKVNIRVKGDGTEPITYTVKNPRFVEVV